MTTRVDYVASIIYYFAQHHGDKGDKRHRCKIQHHQQEPWFDLNWFFLNFFVVGISDMKKTFENVHDQPCSQKNSFP